MKSIRLVKKLIVYVLGLFILALGVAFSVKSNLGVAPVSSVPYVFAKVTGLSMGMATAIVYIVNMVIQAAVLRREYKLVNLLQIGVSFLFGYFTDAALWLASFLPSSDNVIVRFIFLALGISCVALGVFFYLTTSLLALPTDGTVQSIARKGKFKLHNVKIIYDCISTALALTLSLAALHTIQGIGIGTVIAALGVGRMLGLFSTLLKKRLQRFLDNGSSAGTAPGAQKTGQKIVKAG